MSSACDFTRTGHGTYTVSTSDLFYYVTDNNTVFSLRATASPHTATLMGVALALARPPHVALVVKHTQFTDCSSSQQTAPNVAAPAAQNFTAGALAYLVHNAINSSASRYTTWFWAATDERYGIVVGHFASINSHDFTTFTYDCTCTKMVLASYVDPDDFVVIHLCPAFWARRRRGWTGMDSQAWALVQQVRAAWVWDVGSEAWAVSRLSAGCLTGAGLVIQAAIFNFDGGCRDFVTGQDAAKSLSQSSPDQAVFNADNHQYLAEDNQ